jgi:hypothetical protein
MSSVMPYVKWHGRDWLGDQLVRLVPLDVRGVWIDLLCAMMQSDPYGHLAVNGKPMTDDQAARVVGVDIDTYKGCLKQIEDAGISSRTEDGLLYSRRLVREYEIFMRASNAGKSGGGNPALKSKKNPEARSQKPEAKGGIKGVFIPPFKGSELIEAWGRFEKHRTELKNPIRPSGRDAMIKKLSAMPESEAVAVLDQSIENGWQGIFPLKQARQLKDNERSVYEKPAPKQNLAGLS